MRWGRRGRPDGGGDPTAFWSWWDQEGRTLTSRALAAGEPAGTVEPLAEAVSTVHSELSWEVAPGELSTYVLVVTPAGNPDLRATARRWLLAAPASDETWSYSDHRLPRTDPESVRLDSIGGAVAFGDVSVTARLNGLRFDVVVHHPRFADLIEPARLQVAFLALDLTLGEDDVELWIGTTTATEHPLVDGFGLTALRSVVQQHAADHVDEDGRPAWILLQGETPDGPLLASVQVPLHPATAPSLAVHVAVAVPFAEMLSDGLPGQHSLASLRAFEDQVAATLAAEGRLVAHETAGGLRTIHAYVDETSDAVDRVRALAGTWPDGTAVVTARPDPTWAGVAHLSA
ncbi:DUF695 domain-containing protein [Nocardioides mangrovicus]|uniref:DUF695 domain-containing protein n=1 Tax=Nocardioides mangrovicus TaxID=2478913 RepID=A0A3L8P441_9ACTN|nr:DUF695 domain-containing protein [Nocardioides mangrovicus]RLV49198.1 DUF695 domain-containing protein [Nocardioides mangrovicus]